MSGLPLRVLYVGSGDYSSPDEKQALGFAQELLRRGDAVMTSFLGDDALARREGAHDIEGLRVHCHSLSPGGRPAAGDLAAVRDFDPQIVHVLGCRVAAVAAARAYVKASGAALFVHLADDEWGMMRPHGAAQWARRLLWRLRPTAWPHTTPGTLRRLADEATAFDALAPALVQRTEEALGRPCTLILPILPELPAAETAPLPVERVPGRTVALYTGAVSGVHAPDFAILLRALALLRDGGRDVVLVHAGGMHVDRAALLAAAGLTSDAVVFCGHLPPAQLTGLLQGADVLTQPGAPSEFNRLRLPSKLQAYLPSGTPTVTFGIGFGELLQDEVEVLKTHTAEPAELADAIARIIDDPQLAAALSEGGPRAARRLFDAATNVDVLQLHYRDHLAGRIPASG